MELYRKYRPDNFNTVSGNKLLISSLKSLLESKTEIPHSFLFTGPSGCGKTTIGRILAKELGCSTKDFKEVDSAQYGGVESIREIRQQMRFAPLDGSYRVWLLDEAHMIGQGGSSPKNPAQNALLKALEECPPHVYFILCTTEPQQLMKTIKTRCTPYEVKPLADKTIGRLIRGIARKEGVDIPKEVREQIARDSLGSPRQALVLLGKILHLPEEEMLEAAEKSGEEESEVIELCRMMLNKDQTWGKFSRLIKGIDQEPETVRRAVLGYLSAVMLNAKKPATANRASQVMECFLDNFYDSGKAGLVLSCWQACDDIPF